MRFSIFLFYTFFLLQSFFWLSAPRIEYPKLLPELFSFNGNFPLEDIYKAFATSLLIALAVILINLIFALPLAIFLAKNKSKSSNFFSVLFYLPILCPPMITAFGLYEWAIRFNLLGTHFIVILAHSSLLFPYMLKPLENTFKQKGFFHEKVAKDLGSSSIQAFFRITFPKILAPIKFGSFLTLIGSFNDYLNTFLLGEYEVKTLSVILYPLMQADNRQVSILATLGYILPLILLTFFLNKENKNARN